MHPLRHHLRWPGYLFYTVLALAGSSAIWFWPQSPRWSILVSNPEQNINKFRPLFFSSDSKRVFFIESDKDFRQVSIAHYDAHNGTFLERVELWRDRQIDPVNVKLPPGSPPIASPPVYLWPMDVHNNRGLVAVLPQPGNLRDLEYYDVYKGRIPGLKLAGLDMMANTLSKTHRWVHYHANYRYIQEQPVRIHIDRKPDLIIADFKTGEAVLRFNAESDPSSKDLMVYGWEAVFDPTERYVALAWNSIASFEKEDAAEKHQSQIRIYDLHTRKEIRRITLPPGHQWSVKSWEGNYLWTERQWFEYSASMNSCNLSRATRFDLGQDNPRPEEFPLLQNSETQKKTREMDYVNHRRGINWLSFEHRWIFKHQSLPVVLQKITDWLPFAKSFVYEYYPPIGSKVWLADLETGERLWECRRSGGLNAISPDGQSLVTNVNKKDSFEIEVWDTRYPNRWLWIIGYLAILAAWLWWRSRHATRIS